LVRLAAALAAFELAVLVEARRERDVELPAGIGDAPRTHRVVPLVVPCKFVPELGEATVDEHAVLREARAFGPLATDLHTDDVVAGACCTTAPVPVDRRRPATAPDIQHAPGIVISADGDNAVTDL